MRSKKILALALLALVGGLMAGCKSGGAISSDEEQRFKNPPKDAAAQAAKYMSAHNATPPASGQPASAAPR